MWALIWMPLAMEDLANIYVAAAMDEKPRIANAVEALNTRLRNDPLDEGESRSGGYRITFPALLAVVFHVSAEEQVVRVVSVKRFGS